LRVIRLALAALALTDHIVTRAVSATAELLVEVDSSSVDGICRPTGNELQADGTVVHLYWTVSDQ